MTTEVALLRITDLLDDLRGKNHTSDALTEEIDEAISDIRRLNTAIAQLERQLRPFVRRLTPELLTLRGVSTVVAAGLIGHAGNLRTCRNASSFAMRAGAAPVPCSSGRNSSVRVNTGGDRQLNRLLHIIALVQKRTPNHPGQLYYARKRAEGKTHRAAMRSHKRQLATVVFYRLRLATRATTSADLSSAA
jgi:transposase